jgi:hypothetical protein
VCYPVGARLGDMCLPRHLGVVTVLTTLAAVHAAAQQPVPLFSVDAELSDFGIADVGDVVRGRISLVHDPSGDRIVLHFLRTVPLATPPPLPSPEALPRPTGDVTQPGLEAMWVWNTSELLADPPARADFLGFVQSQGIERIFLYLPAAEGERPMSGYIPFDGDALAPLLSELHARGALTYALDGDPDYVREENRAGILRTIRRVAEHNRSHPPDQRFHGVRYDVEPYLLRGFQGPRRAEILAQYVSLLADIAAEAHAADLAVGVDVPFWFDAGDEETGEPFEAVHDGERRPVLEHVMSLVDDVGLMAYRTSAFGADGVLTHAAGEISLGDRTGVGVFVGVETTRLYDEELYTFRGDARLGPPPVPDTAWVFMEDLGSDRVRIWLAQGADAVAELSRRVDDMGALRYWFAGVPVPLPGDKLSFYSLGPDAMQAVTDEVVRHFGGDPAFLGLAYHDYGGLSGLIER